MNDVFAWIKTIIMTLSASVMAEIGMLTPLITLLFLVMIIDYVTGMVAAGINGQLNSKIGFRGIIKKFCYVFVVTISLIIDKVIIVISNQFGFEIKLIAFFATLTCVWLILNEILSIFENLGKLNVPLPEFLSKTIKTLKHAVEERSKNQNNK